MRLARERLVVLLNALYDEGVTSIGVTHPSDAIGELFRIDLEEDASATVRFTSGAYTYEEARESIPAHHGAAAYEELPDPETYVRTVVASGLVDVANREEIDEFVHRHGYADLEAGHEPVVLGMDANLMAWDLPDVLGLDPATGRQDDEGRTPINGYALATGVKEELDWIFDQYNTHELTAAFGDEYDRLDDQPAGSNREGFLGLYEYRRLRAQRTADLVECEEGDEAIVEGYRRYNEESRKTAILLSNDGGFVDRATDAGVPAQRVRYEVDLPRKATGTWTAAADLLYYVAVVFGVVSLPKVTLYGVWNGKDGLNWQHEEIDVHCRSPRVEPRLARDRSILETVDG